MTAQTVAGPFSVPLVLVLDYDNRRVGFLRNAPQPRHNVNHLGAILVGAAADGPQVVKTDQPRPCLFCVG